MERVIKTLTKTEREDLLKNFEFADVDTDAGESIVSVLDYAVSPSGLTFSTPTHDATHVQALLSDGVDGTTYHVTCLALTNLDQKLEGCGYLLVQNC